MTHRTTWLYDDGYNYGWGLPVRQVHGFVLDKARRIRHRLIDAHGLTAGDFDTPPAAPEAALHTVHTPEHLADLGTSEHLARAAELPWLAFLPAFMTRRALLAPQLLATGGTVAALERAANGEWVFNLAGGYHHARPALAHGFCLIADVAVADSAVNLTGPCVVLDLDTHQGDGNAVAFQDRPDIFTVSVHEDAAFPNPKPPSDLDRGLPPGLDDDAYLAVLDDVLVQVSERVQPSVVVYIAGTDILDSDPLGAQRVTAEGILERDRRVARWVRAHGAGLVVLPAGGYSEASPRVSADGFAAMAELATD